VGKKVIVGRIPLCVPNTYNANLSYAGKPAVVAGFKPNTQLNAPIFAGLPPALRAQMADLKKGGTLLFQFDDGTKLDTCVVQGLSALAPNLELVPGETIAVPPPAQSPTQALAARTALAAGASHQQCPISVVKVGSGNSFGHLVVDSLTTSELQRQIDETNHGGMGKHYLDIQVRNDSAKAVKAFEFSAVYADRMGDDASSASFVSQNDRPIASGAVYKTSAIDRDQIGQSGTGDVSVYVSRVRFADDSFWQDDGSRSCARKSAVK
jgi:hypothetical protein